MKVVINRCFGGFGLSKAAMARLAELKGWTHVPETPREVEYWIDANGAPWWTHEIERHDPLLVQVVEELGEAANGQSARLKVVEIPDVTWEITDYDGMEKVRQVGNEWY